LLGIPIEHLNHRFDEMYLMRMILLGNDKEYRDVNWYAGNQYDWNNWLTWHDWNRTSSLACFHWSQYPGKSISETNSLSFNSCSNVFNTGSKGVNAFGYRFWEYSWMTFNADPVPLC
jgi:hypothetical protein